MERSRTSWPSLWLKVVCGSRGWEGSSELFCWAIQFLCKIFKVWGGGRGSEESVLSISPWWEGQRIRASIWDPFLDAQRVIILFLAIESRPPDSGWLNSIRCLTCPVAKEGLILPFTVCLSLSGLLKQNTINWVAYKQQKFISCSTRGWEVHSQGTTIIRVWWGLTYSCLFTVTSHSKKNKKQKNTGSSQRSLPSGHQIHSWELHPHDLFTSQSASS